VTTRASRRHRTKLLEDFLAAFDNMVASGALYNRVPGKATQARFDSAKLHLQLVREQIAATEPSK